MYSRRANPLTMNKGHDFIRVSQRMMSVSFIKELQSSKIYRLTSFCSWHIMLILHKVLRRFRNILGRSRNIDIVKAYKAPNIKENIINILRVN